MFNVLRNGGRCSVIVPDGILYGKTKAHESIRKLLVERCNLHTVISMPQGVFKPYAGVSTAVLFFTKGEATKEIWFYDMENDGFSLDDKRIKIEENDIPEIIIKFKNRKKEDNSDRKKKHFFVPIKEIKKNDYDLNISEYREIEYKEKKYDKTKDMKIKIIDLEEKIIEGIGKIPTNFKN